MHVLFGPSLYIGTMLPFHRRILFLFVFLLSGCENEAKTMLTTIMKTRNPKYETSATSDALLQEIELQKRIEMWGEGRRLFDMKRRNDSLDRTHAINHSAIAPKEVPAGSKLFIYQIPDKELNANSEITDKNE